MHSGVFVFVCMFMHVRVFVFVCLCVPAICACLQRAVKHMIARLQVAVRIEYKVTLVSTIFKALAYNSQLTLMALEEVGATGMHAYV